MNDAVVAASTLPPRPTTSPAAAARLQPFDHIGVAAGRHKADVLAVVLVGDRQAELAGELARLGLAEIAKREPQEIKLRVSGAEQKVALVALLLLGAIERAGAAGHHPRRDVMSGGQHLGAQVARGPSRS